MEFLFRFAKFCFNVVFTGLKPSRKPRLVPHPLPHHLLRPLRSCRDQQSRRRRSWAQMMRSRRTLQTTVKVRVTDTHMLNSSVWDLVLSKSVLLWLSLKKKMFYSFSFLSFLSLSITSYRDIWQRCCNH